MSERLPVVSGAQLIDALAKLGWVSIRPAAAAMFASSIRSAPSRWWCHFLASSKRGTLAGILRDVGVDREKLRGLL